jgi:hypothetical protein
MDIQKQIKNSLNIIKAEPLLLIFGGLLVLLLNLLSVGLLTGPLLGGYLLMIILMLREGRKPHFNDLFSGFSRLGQLFPFLFLNLLIIIGFVFLIIPGIVMMIWWLYVLMLMADKEMSLGQAMAASRAKVLKEGFFMHLVFAFMITLVPILLINFAAVLLPPLKILEIVLMPLQCGCLASLYLEQFSEAPRNGAGKAVEPDGVKQNPALPPLPPGEDRG